MTFPYKFITIASGVFGLNIFLFIIISIVGRGLRFYLIAIFLYFFGEKIKLIIDKYFNILIVVFFILLIGSVFIIRFYDNSNWTTLLFIISLISISSALIAEYFFNLQPCELCLKQRHPYYLILICLILIFLFKNLNKIWLYLVIQFASIYGLFYSIWHG